MSEITPRHQLLSGFPRRENGMSVHMAGHHRVSVRLAVSQREYHVWNGRVMYYVPTSDDDKDGVA